MVIFNYGLMCLIFGTTFFAIKVGVSAGLPPFLSAGIRFAAAGLLLLCWLIARRQASIKLLLRKELLLIGAGSTFATFAGLYWAEQHIQSGIAAVLSATAPMAILLLQAVALRQRPSRLEKLGCVIGLAGVSLLMLPGLHAQSSWLWLISCLLILLVQLGYAAGSLMSRRVLLADPELSPVALNAVQMTSGGAGLLLLSAMSGELPAASIQWEPALSSLLYLIAAGSMLGHTLYAWLLKATDAFFPSTWLYISPVIALGLGTWLNGEPISWLSMAGSLLVLAAIIVPRLPELRTYGGRQAGRHPSS